MTKIGRPSLWEEKRAEWVHLYCEERLSRGQIARQYGTSVQSVTRQLLAAGVDLESRVGANPNAGRTPERQAEINAKVSESRKGKGTGPRVERESRTCQNPKCGQEYEYIPGRTGEKFCSKGCQMSVQGQRSAEEARAAYTANPSRRCPCGEAIPYEYRHNRVFCSPEHQKEYQTKRQKDPTKHVMITCQNETCGKQIERYKNYGNGHLKYCSNECARRHTKTRKFYAIGDLDIIFESSWECLLWSLCTFLKLPVERYDRDKGIKWGEDGWYAPDFWLPSHRIAVEVKGQPDEDDYEKWDAFREREPLIVILQYQLDQLRLAPDKVVFASLLASFEAAQSPA
jgi:hypothetical protein